MTKRVDECPEYLSFRPRILSLKVSQSPDSSDSLAAALVAVEERLDLLHGRADVEELVDQRLRPRKLHSLLKPLLPTRPAERRRVNAQEKILDGGGKYRVV